MAAKKESEVAILLQPDLLTVDELIVRIQSRCCRIQNLSVMSKERLVGIFRRVLLPLPQRFYRTNRRGKMLTARRAKAGLEGGGKRGREEAGCLPVEEESHSRVSLSRDRLKPPPDISRPHRIRINSHDSDDKGRLLSGGSEGLGIDRTSGKDEESTIQQFPSSTTRNISFKRTLPDAEMSPKGGKKQRTAIKWP